jgi:putative transcriptional regulator
LIKSTLKLKDTIDFVNGILSSKGRVLLSEPFLQDPHFERSVVLMCEHSDAESFGFVLNHQSTVQLKDLMDIAPDSIPIYLGGPVANNSLFYLHMIPGIDSSEEILPGLFYGGDLAELLEIIEIDSGILVKIRFFLGYSGWGKGQLAQEIKERSWISTTNLSLESLFFTPTDKLWKTCMSFQGEQFKTFSIFPKNIADN